MKLTKREYRFPAKSRIDHPILKQFLAPQREHPKTPMPPREKA